MITTSNSPRAEGAGHSINYSVFYFHTIAWYELSRVRTELFKLLVIASLVHHPVHPNRQSARHRDLGDLSSPTHHQMVVLAPPSWIAAHRHLGRFHKQEAQQRVPLFGDMAQPSSTPARVLQRHQSQITRD